MATINQIAETIMKIAGEKLSIRHIAGPTGVRARNSDNSCCKRNLIGLPAKA
jgi:hypothetical protein